MSGDAWLEEYCETINEIYLIHLVIDDRQKYGLTKEHLDGLADLAVKLMKQFYYRHNVIKLATNARWEFIYKRIPSLNEGEEQL